MAFPGLYNGFTHVHTKICYYCTCCCCTHARTPTDVPIVVYVPNVPTLVPTARARTIPTVFQYVLRIAALLIYERTYIEKQGTAAE